MRYLIFPRMFQHARFVTPAERRGVILRDGETVVADGDAQDDE